MIKKLGICLMMILGTEACHAQTYTETPIDKEEFIGKENPIEFLRKKFSKDTADVFITSGHFYDGRGFH